ncbi:hypothetical protein B0H13DRAFT_2336567 [Mycena leptocephala]|nr:hypothetical protein B0H13DRAFT_2336567 [Mycena leptocephala]
MSFLLSRKPSSKNSNYICRGTLRGHVGAIVSLGATDDGKLLASGATDSTRVWDLEAMQKLRSPSSPGTRGATTAIAGIKRDDDPGEAPRRMVFAGQSTGGCLIGTLVVLRIDAVVAKKKDHGPVAFEHDWLEYDPNHAPPEYLLQTAKEEKQILAIQAKLVAPLALKDEEPANEPVVPEDEQPANEPVLPEDDEEMPLVTEGDDDMPPLSKGDDGMLPVSEAAKKQLHSALARHNLTPLRFVAYSLDLDMKKARTKADFADILITWRLTKPLADFSHEWASYTDDVDAVYRLKKPESEAVQISQIQERLMKPLVTENSQEPCPNTDGPSRNPGDSHEPSPTPGEEDRRTAERGIQEERAAYRHKRDEAAVKLTMSLKKHNKKSLRFVVYSLGLDMRGPDTKYNYASKLTTWRLTKPLVNPHWVSKAIDLTKLKFIQRVIANTATPSWIHSVPKAFGEGNVGTIKADEWRILATIYLPIALILLWGDWDGESAGGSEPSRLLAMLDHSMALFQAVVIACRFAVTTVRATAYRNFIKDWLSHPNCPDVIKQFKCLFDLAYTPRRNLNEVSAPLAVDGERAHYTYRGVNFSRASTDLGNSLILYYPSLEADPIAGTIEKIVTQGDVTEFTVRHQAPLPTGSFDPFLHYAYFPAKSYASQMEDTIDMISPSSGMTTAPD